MNRNTGKSKDGLSSSARIILIAAGTLSLAAGTVGIFLPVLPTTPFLLLAAACYAKGSGKLCRWLLGNKFFGHYIISYRTGMGIPLSLKIRIIIFLWLTILGSVIFLIHVFWLRIMLLITAAAVTVHVAAIKGKKDGASAVPSPEDICG